MGDVHPSYEEDDEAPEHLTGIAWKEYLVDDNTPRETLVEIGIRFERQRLAAALESQLADARRGMREEAAKVADAHWHWQGAAIATKIRALPIEAVATPADPDEISKRRREALEEIALMDADEIMAIGTAPPATGEVTR